MHSGGPDGGHFGMLPGLWGAMSFSFRGCFTYPAALFPNGTVISNAHLCLHPRSVFSASTYLRQKGFAAQRYASVRDAKNNDMRRTALSPASMRGLTWIRWGGLGPLSSVFVGRLYPLETKRYVLAHLDKTGPVQAQAEASLLRRLCGEASACVLLLTGSYLCWA